MAILLLSGNGCTKYNPSLFPSYDVLNPGEEVRKNPLAVAEITEEGELIIHEDVLVGPGVYFIVDKAFMMWVFELKEEIKKLRKLVK